jgi:sulfonate transport system substrate-binding protein
MSPSRFTATISAIALLFIAACGNSNSSASQTKSLSDVTLHVGSTGWLSTKAALEFAGLANTEYKVDWSLFQGGDQQLEAIKSGALDVTNSSEIPPIFAAIGGSANYKVVAVQKGNTLLQEVVTKSTSGITSIGQLKGKKVAYVKNTTAQYFLVKLLEQARLSWSDITPVALSTADGVAALSAGSVDALASYGNAIIATHAVGDVTIGSGEDILSGNFQWQASDSLLRDDVKKEALADLLNRVNQAWAYIRAHFDGYAALTAKATKQSQAQALSTLKNGEEQRPTTLLPTSAAAIASQQMVANTFTSINALPKKVDVASFWSTALNSLIKETP